MHHRIARSTGARNAEQDRVAPWTSDAEFNVPEPLPMSAFIKTCSSKQINPLFVLGVVLNNTAARGVMPADNPAQALREAALRLIRNGQDCGPAQPKSGRQGNGGTPPTDT